jgi:hypothetical protein
MMKQFCHFTETYWYHCKLNQGITTEQFHEVRLTLLDTIGDLAKINYQQYHASTHILAISFSRESDAIMFKLLYSEL